MKTTKRALFSSVVALILCFSMLVGTTFAWFTDEVTSGVNQIVAGNLDIELYNGLDVNAPKVTEETKLFHEITYWEPGVVAYENLTVANLGNLALKYQLSVNFTDATANANGDTLAKVLKVGFVKGGIPADASREAALGLVTEWLPLASFVQPGELAAVEEDQIDANVYGIVIYWQPSDIDNEFNMNNGLTNVMSINLGVRLFATQLAAEEDSFGPDYDGATEWLGGEDYSWYDPDATELTISNAEQLAALAALINGTATPSVSTYAAEPEAVQDSFADQVITLTSDIDLAGMSWTPIGNWDNAFEGTFDGNGHTIYNLCVNDPAGEGVGLFGVVANATIKNLTVENVNIEGYSMVSALVGAAYPATISNCHVTGNINVVADWAYVGGIAGYCYYGTQVDACSVIANDGSKLESVTRNAVGGITAWLLEGDHKVTNCSVENLDLIGWTNVGGITGFVHYSNTIDNCSVKNVNVVKTRVDGNPGIGLVAGGYSYSAANAITLSNNSVENVTLSGNHIAYATYNELYGSEYGGATTANFVLENNTVSGITNNLVEVTKVTGTDALKAAINAGEDKIVLGAGNYTLPATTGDVTIMGTLDAVITIDKPTANNVTLKGVTVVGSGNYTGIQHSNKVVYENCLVKGVQFLYANEVQFINCVVDLTEKADYIWTYGAKNVTFDGCEFNTAGKAILIYAEEKGLVNNITVKNCVFNASASALAGGQTAAAIEIDSSLATNGHYTLTTENNTVDSDFAGEWRIKKSGVDNTTVNGVVYNGTTLGGKRVAYTAAELENIVNNATGELTVHLAKDITGDVTLVQKPDVKVVIDGNGHKFNGVVLVNGKSARYETTALTIQNVNFEAETLSADAFIRLGDGVKGSAVRYSNNVTVKNCTFSGNGIVAVKSYEGGDWNVTLENLTVNAGMHSLAQLKNVEKNLVVIGCKVYSKNGLNVNNSNNLVMDGCTFDVQGYAVRFGSDSNTTDETFNISNSTLKSACAESGDAVIEIRAGASNCTLNLDNTTIEGTVQFKGHENATINK